MKKIIAGFTFILAVLFAGSLWAADLYGIVTGKSGAPVETKLELKDAKDGKIAASSTSDKKGNYSFKDIKMGSYLMVINAKEFKVQVAPGDTRRDFQLDK